MNHDKRFLRLLSRLSLMQAAALIALLGVAVPLKYLAGFAAGVTLVGTLHGALWLVYMWLVLAMASLRMWSKLDVLRLVLSALLPFGGFATALWINGISKELPINAD